MNAEILFVDDDPDVLSGFRRSLRKEFTIDTAIGGAQALAMMPARPPYAVVVADMQMPGMNGVRFLTQVEALAPDTIRMMLTGNADQKTARDAVNEGHIFRFLTKPCPQDELVRSLRAALQQYKIVTAERDVLERTLNGSAKMLSDILALHDPYSFGRSERLRDHMRAFAEHLKLRQTWDLELAAMLSQIGCVTIPQSVLEKARASGFLAGPEAEMIARVPQIGHNLLSNIPRLEPVAAIVLYQNKNFDGSGFPVDKVAGEEIPIGARILRVLQDVVEQESGKMSRDKVLEKMTQSSGCYDPKVLEAVAAVFDICLASVPAPETQARSVNITELRVGNVLAADVRTRGGMLLIRTGVQISPFLMEKLRNFAELRDLEQPILVA